MTPEPSVDVLAAQVRKGLDFLSDDDVLREDRDEAWLALEVLVGYAKRAEQLAERLDRVIDAGVERWHTTVNDEPALHEWLGLTWDEYKAWVERG